MTRDRCEYLLAELAITVPELAPALARINMTEAPSSEVQAAAKALGGDTTIGFISLTGTGMIASEVLDQDLEGAKMVLAHEAMHLVASRVARIKDLAGPQWDGNHARANIAADRWINQILVDLRVCTEAKVKEWGGALPKDGMAEADLMDIWRAEPKSTKNSGKPMAGCAPHGGKDEATEGDKEADGDLERDQEAHSILAGMSTYSATLRKMINPPPPTVRWQDVLHEAAAAARGAGISARPRVTRAKWGRRSTPEIPKPGKASRKPQLVVVVDISGSMSGLLDSVVAETDAIGKHSHVHLVLHDAAVLFSGQYKKGRDHIRPCGGTDFTPAIREAERVVKTWPGRSVVVHLTDGFPCGEWPDVPADFSAGYAGIFGDAGSGIKGPGKWRTRRCGKVGG